MSKYLEEVLRDNLLLKQQKIEMEKRIEVGDLVRYKASYCIRDSSNPILTGKVIAKYKGEYGYTKFLIENLKTKVKTMLNINEFKKIVNKC